MSRSFAASAARERTPEKGSPFYRPLRVTRVIRTRSNGAISALFGLSSLEYRRIPASSAPKISRNFIRLSPIGFSDEQIVVPARQSPQVLLYVTARGLTKQERRDAVRKRGSDNSRYPNLQKFQTFLHLFAFLSSYTAEGPQTKGKAKCF